MTSFPQVEYVLRGALLCGEIVDVPETATHAGQFDSTDTSKYGQRRQIDVLSTVIEV